MESKLSARQHQVTPRCLPCKLQKSAPEDLMPAYKMRLNNTYKVIDANKRKLDLGSHEKIF